MKSTILGLSLLLLGNYAFAQDRNAAKKLIEAGIEFHDKGDYKKALKKYDDALDADKNNLAALTEKSITLATMGDYKEAIKVCKLAIKTHPHEPNIAVIYSSYGNSLDGLHQTEDAIAIYDEGIKEFPDYFYLYFNKGVALMGLKKNAEADLCFQQAIIHNPSHGSSHGLIAQIERDKPANIPALMAASRALVLDPQSEKAKINLKILLRIMTGNIKEAADNSINMYVSDEVLKDMSDDKAKSKENNFSATEMALSISATMDYNEFFKNDGDMEKFTRKYKAVCESLKELKAQGKGFFWDYYAPYFIDMLDKNLIETFAYIAFASTEDIDILKWLAAHEKDVTRFFKWDSEFKWYQK